MVLERRTPVVLKPELKLHNRDAEVWYIPATGEGFQTYEEYSKRYDYLKQRIFACEITGRGGYDYWEALQSETQGAISIDTAFSEQLKYPILKKIQFSTQSRIDEVVESLYQEYQKEFFPGESVIVIRDDVREDGQVRDKAVFPQILNQDGTVQREGKSRYFVTLSKKINEEIAVAPDQLVRSRKTFNKSMLRSFLKNSVTREPWSGAPWVVKRELAEQYRIPTEIPEHLQHDYIMEAKKAANAKQRGYADERYLNQLAAEGKLPGVPPGEKLTQAQVQQFQEMYRAMPSNGNNPPFHSKPGLLPNGKFPGHFGEMQFTTRMPRVPAVKYPCEDLILPFDKRRKTGPRPTLKYLTSEAPALAITETDVDIGPLTGPLLQIWDTLNVFAAFYMIDSFTFDDFIQAMVIASNEVQCELFDEVHCAVLKKLVDDEGEMQAKSMVTLLDYTWDESEDEEEPPNQEEPEPEEPLSRRKGRKPKVAQEESIIKSNGDGVSTKRHLAQACVGEEEWTSMLKERDFTNGGWQMIMVGFLMQASLKQTCRPTCEEILSKLVPPEDSASTRESVWERYGDLDLESRVNALNLVVLMTAETKPLKNFIDECDRDSTETRKQKITWQSKKKPKVKDWTELDEQRKLLRPDAHDDIAKPKAIEDESDGEDEDMREESNDTSEVNAKSEDEEEADTMLSTRSSGRASEMKRKREEMAAEQERKKKQKVEVNDNTKYEEVLKELKRLSKEIKECEVEIQNFDDQLRENACHRVRLLGSDRYLNHYYWFERNAMPFGGNPDSSTAEYEYANGCIWVQGPLKEEAEHVVYLEPEQAEEYKKIHKVTLAERRSLDEPDTKLLDADQWGYLDEPKDLEQLISYLDERGVREKHLLKELRAFQNEIAARMEARRKHLDDVAQRRAESEDPVVGVATRRKRDVSQQEAKFPCLAWYNSLAREELGHLHSEGKIVKQGRKKGVARAKEASSTAVQPATRQGTRYSRR